MYKLTPKMQQSLQKGLRSFHKLFDGGRCSAWQLEELIVNAIKADNIKGHNPRWKEGGHDTKADITIECGNGRLEYLQVKSGTIKKEHLELSGYRLGRFNKDLGLITDFLNGAPADIISVPYKKLETQEGRVHEYRICSLPKKALQGLNADSWEQRGKSFYQENKHGTIFKLSPSMSWQIWWEVPLEHADMGTAFEIC